MVDFSESFGLFFVVELTDGLGGVLESGVIDIDHNLRNDGSDFAIDTFLCKSIMDGLGKPIADLTLTHSDGGFEWHGWGFVGRGLLFVN